MICSDNSILSAYPFGKTSECEQVTLISMTSEGGNIAKVSSYGAALQSLVVKDRNGFPVDVVLGYDTAEGYEINQSCFGSTMGRCTGRAENAEIVISEKAYKLSENRKGYHMHGGFKGFHKRLWNYELIRNGVRFSLFSPDGDEGYPGNLTANIIYRWDSGNTLSIEYNCFTDKETAINFTNHSYFNLAGHDSGRIGAIGQELTIFADYVAELNEKNMISGKFLPVSGTPLDFNGPVKIGERIGSDFRLMKAVGGYDHNFQLNGKGMKDAAILRSPETGITMAVSSELPMLGLYTANFLAEHTGKDNALYGKNSGVCLETQFLPDSIKLPDYGQKPIFKGEEYHFTTVYTFSIS